MFIIQLTYKAPLQEVDKYLQSHREFLDYYYMQGLFIASGPMKPRTGDILIAITSDRKGLDVILKQDPFYMANIADYELLEFTPVKHCVELQELILKREGKLC